MEMVVVSEKIGLVIIIQTVLMEVMRNNHYVVSKKIIQRDLIYLITLFKTMSCTSIHR